ncbi:hypothetical protein HJG60_011366 [Phyllostomus discolor]|uniref:Uncharacterized protein n=1 Tax=Phyllostomus discolor TaxID=89673 RepID=A0A834E5I8_9CHIR|nr:hypothetical protein HJG60_011366 [Phyllostomus discolor]
MFLYRVLLNEMNTQIRGLGAKQIVLRNVGGPVPSVGGWNRTKDRLPANRRKLVDGFHSRTATMASPWVWSVLTCPADSELVSPYHPMSQFLKISLSSPTPYWFCFSGEPKLTQILCLLIIKSMPRTSHLMDEKRERGSP